MDDADADLGNELLLDVVQVTDHGLRIHHVAVRWQRRRPDDLVEAQGGEEVALRVDVDAVSLQEHPRALAVPQHARRAVDRVEGA
jgi:hypothetical protein